MHEGRDYSRRDGRISRIFCLCKLRIPDPEEKCFGTFFEPRQDMCVKRRNHVHRDIPY
jgi:hypothetical protein